LGCHPEVIVLSIRAIEAVGKGVELAARSPGPRSTSYRIAAGAPGEPCARRCEASVLRGEPAAKVIRNDPNRYLGLFTCLRQCRDVIERAGACGPEDMPPRAICYTLVR
jgi:hypothetical protein